MPDLGETALSEQPLPHDACAFVHQCPRHLFAVGQRRMRLGHVKKNSIYIPILLFDMCAVDFFLFHKSVSLQRGTEEIDGRLTEIDGRWQFDLTLDLGDGSREDKLSVGARDFFVAVR